MLDYFVAFFPPRLQVISLEFITALRLTVLVFLSGHMLWVKKKVSAPINGVHPFNQTHLLLC